jgi:hypothetical protein
MNLVLRVNIDVTGWFQFGVYLLLYMKHKFNFIKYLIYICYFKYFKIGYVQYLTK